MHKPYNNYSIRVFAIGGTKLFKIINSKKVFKSISLFITGAVIVSILVYACSAFAESRKGIKLPIIMYHSILKDESKLGEYVLSPLELESDMLYLKEHGYTPIMCQDLISYVYSDKELPEKPVILSFDDGCYNNMYYVLPLLSKYNMKAVFAVVGTFCDKAESENDPNPNYSYMSWQDCKDAYTSGRVEIACHSDNLHTLGERKGAKRKYNESYDEYRSVFMSDTLSFIDKIKSKSEIIPNTYVYPYGAISDDSMQLVKACGFKVSFSVEEKLNYITKDEECLYRLNRYNRESGVSTEDFMKKALDE